MPSRANAAIFSGQATLNSSTATVLAAAIPGGAPRVGNTLIVKNPTASGIVVYVGAAGVTSSTGYVLEAGTSTPPIFVDDPSRVYAISASGTPTICFVYS